MAEMVKVEVEVEKALCDWAKQHDLDFSEMMAKAIEAERDQRGE